MKLELFLSIHFSHVFFIEPKAVPSPLVLKSIIRLREGSEWMQIPISSSLSDDFFLTSDQI